MASGTSELKVNENPLLISTFKKIHTTKTYVDISVTCSRVVSDAFKERGQHTVYMPQPSAFTRWDYELDVTVQANVVMGYCS